jgi:hypothetical protein
VIPVSLLIRNVLHGNIGVKNSLPQRWGKGGRGEMIQKVQLDFEIKIGIKDNEPISIDWSGLLLKDYSCNKKDIINMLSKIQKYLSGIKRTLND